MCERKNKLLFCVLLVCVYVYILLAYSHMIDMNGYTPRWIMLKSNSKWYKYQHTCIKRHVFVKFNDHRKQKTFYNEHVLSPPIAYEH